MTTLLIVKLKNCEICDELYKLFLKKMQEDKIQKVKFVEETLRNRSQLHRLGLREVSGFPMLLAYKNGKLRLGWEGFAALAPDEIKREMVEDVLRQVAALADEDDIVADGNGAQMPKTSHRVRDDNTGVSDEVETP